MERRPAAFFDLDRTLVPFNSGWLYAKRELAEGRISRLLLARAGVALGMYHLSLINMPKAYRKMLAHYRGVSETIVDERTREWFVQDVAPHLLPGARATLEAHRGAGHPTVVLTNSSAYAARYAAEAWGLDDWIANHFSMDPAGRLDGDFVAPLCHGEGKVVRAEAWAAERDVDLDASWFYSDSLSDVPMLERVGRPRVVNPDPRLRRYARRKGWPILDWERPELPTGELEIA